MVHHEEAFLDVDGARLWTEDDVPSGARAHVLVVHGYADHLGRYRAFRDALLAEGLGVHTYDQRGHGKSPGPRGHVRRFSDYLDEAERLLHRALELRPETGAFLDSLGWLFFRRHDLGRAVSTLEHAASLDPDEPVIAEHLGDAYLGVQRRRDAVNSYRRALEAARTSTDPDVAALRPRVEGKLKGLSSDVADR